MLKLFLPALESIDKIAAALVSPILFETIQEYSPLSLMSTLNMSKLVPWFLIEYFSLSKS